MARTRKPEKPRVNPEARPEDYANETCVLFRDGTMRRVVIPDPDDEIQALVEALSMAGIQTLAPGD